MTRNDIYFTPDSEEFIINCAERLKNPNSLAEEFIILSNILYVERKDERGRRIKTSGPFVNIGVDTSKRGLEDAKLPISGKSVYLSGFDKESGITIKLNNNSEKRVRLCIDRDL